MSRKIQSVRYSPYFDPRQTTDGESSGGKTNRKTKTKKFGDLTEEDVMKLLLPDRVDYNLDILFIGINPGLTSAYKGHHYAGPNNHFWPCLFDSKIIPEKLTYKEDEKCPSFGIGLTNIVMRTTRSSSDLSRKEIKDGVDELITKIKKLKPLIACFNGKGIYEIFSGSKCQIGNQPNCIPRTNVAVYVMPSTSGRTMTYPRASDKLPFFKELKELRDSKRAALLQDMATTSLTQENNQKKTESVASS